MIREALFGLAISAAVVASCSSDTEVIVANHDGGGGSESNSSSSSSGEFDAGAPAMCQDCLSQGCASGSVDAAEFTKYESILKCVQKPEHYELCPSCEMSPGSNECRRCVATEFGPECDLDCANCGINEVIATCEHCSRTGACGFNDPKPGQCYAGIVAYTDQIGCMQASNVQVNCPDYGGINVGDIITAECVGCAKAFVNPTCRLSCAANFPQ